MVEEAEVSRVKNAVAQPCNSGSQCERPPALGHTQQHHSQAQQENARGQRVSRPEAVDRETRQRLTEAGDDEKHGHQSPDLGEGQTESRHQPRKQRWQNQVEEVRSRMADGDE